MRKIRRIYETTQEINFLPQKEFSLYWKSFQQSELGRIFMLEDATYYEKSMYFMTNVKLL
jgi:hypothetical protein